MTAHDIIVIAICFVAFAFCALSIFYAGHGDPVEKARDDLAYGDIAQLPTDVFPVLHSTAYAEKGPQDHGAR